MMLALSEIEWLGCGRHDRMLAYAAMLRAGKKAPPILVTKQGNRYSIFDGAHRACATKYVGRTTVKACIIAAPEAGKT